MDKKGQFFLFSFIVLAFALMIIFTYFNTTTTSSIALFDSNPSVDLQNIINAIDDKNDWLANESWYNSTWKYRKEVTMTVGVSSMVDISIPAGHVSNCRKEIRVYNGSLVTALVNQSAYPCKITFDAIAGTYEIYYGNSLVTADYNDLGSGILTTPTIGAEETSQVCDHIEYIYQEVGRVISCSAANYPNAQKVNYSLSFYTPELKFSGYLS